MRSLLLLAAAPAARAILSDACQIALGEDDFFEAFKASKVAIHFNASNAACENAKRSSVNDFLGGQLTKDTSVACGCHREYLARMCTRDDASLYVIQSANRLKGSKTLRLHTLACLPNDCTSDDVSEFVLARDSDAQARSPARCATCLPPFGLTRALPPARRRPRQSFSRSDGRRTACRCGRARRRGRSSAT